MRGLGEFLGLFALESSPQTTFHAEIALGDLLDRRVGEVVGGRKARLVNRSGQSAGICRPRPSR